MLAAGRHNSGCRQERRARLLPALAFFLADGARRLRASAERSKPCCHKGRQAFVHTVEIGRFAKPPRQLVDSSGLRKRQCQGAAEELIAPKHLAGGTLRQRFAQNRYESFDQGIEMLGHEHRTPFRRVIDLRHEGEIAFPPGTTARRAKRPPSSGGISQASTETPPSAA